MSVFAAFVSARAALFSSARALGVFGPRRRRQTLCAQSVICLFVGARQAGVSGCSGILGDGAWGKSTF